MERGFKDKFFQDKINFLLGFKDTTAQKILDDDHFGLEKVKERIIEFLAVQKRIQKLKGPILSSF